MKLKQFVCKAASIAMCAMIIGTTVAVSYTHLDVYKRQYQILS